MSPPSTDAQRARAGAAADSTLGPESSFDAQWIEPDRPVDERRPWTSWRLLATVLLTAVCSLGLFLWLQALVVAPHLPGQWRPTASGGAELAHSDDATLRPYRGRELLVITRQDGHRIAVDADVLGHSPRGIVDDAQRNRVLALQAELGLALRDPLLTLGFDDGGEVAVRPSPRGWSGLSPRFWLQAALTVALFVLAVVTVTARPTPASLLYGALAFSQGLNLMLIGVESLQGLGLPPGFVRADLLLRVACDLVAAAILLQLCMITPQRLPAPRWLAPLGWLPALAYAGLCAWVSTRYAWWATQSLLVGYGLMAIAVLSWSQRRQPHPVTIVLRRLAAAATGTLLLLTLAIALASRDPSLRHVTVQAGPVIWYVFFAALLLLLQFVSRPQKLMRELALLAGVSSVATSLDLIVLAALPVGQFAATALTLFVSLGLYGAARHWLLGPQFGAGTLTAERMFESLYRIAREVELAPRKTAEQLTRLLSEFFEPLEVVRATHAASRTRVAGNGSTLIVPLPRLPGAVDLGEPEGVIVLRFAQRGHRLFTIDDARLTDRVIEQLHRAVAFDRAVEHGRSEERTRIAQDLHDDIGARLLTMMYKAQNPEMEEYVRHTLQDLKTLTRGLAAANHRLSHAAAEWKSDITQRLALTDCDLDWSFSADRDILLTVVQWSALTRILRELVNNIIAHAKASRVEISGQYDRGRLTLTVVDDGIGRQPEAWSHGLGLGGVRKRVKLLAGEVTWRERGVQGIRCEVRIRLPGTRD